MAGQRRGQSLDARRGMRAWQGRTQRPAANLVLGWQPMWVSERGAGLEGGGARFQGAHGAVGCTELRTGVQGIGCNWGSQGSQKRWGGSLRSRGWAGSRALSASPAMKAVVTVLVVQLGVMSFARIDELEYRAQWVISAPDDCPAPQNVTYSSRSKQ